MLKTILTVSLLFLITGCSHNYGNTGSLAGLQVMGTAGSKSGPSKVNNIRKQALIETGLSVGAQAGLAARAKEINAILKNNTKQLDRIYDFNALLMSHNVLPPVLVEGRDSLNLASIHAIRLADRTYKIVQQAHFVTVSPNWRNYLWLSYKRPDRPNNTLLPKNKAELKIWNHAVQKGWVEGIKQANNIFSDNLARLTRDYTGMVRYRILLAQNMVSAPFVATTQLGITGGGNHMRINDEVLRITSLPSLSTQSKKWRTALAHE